MPDGGAGIVGHLSGHVVPHPPNIHTSCSGIDLPTVALCVEKMFKCQKEVPEKDITALVVASSPKDLLDTTLKE